ncbi:MAG: CinA family protein [Sphingobacteriales bacterium]|nr:MAG: CinA family protein [Sphingobacteriales bacterium]
MFDDKKISQVKDHLKRKHETIAVAESVTSGLLQAALGSAEMATDFYQGGLTAYNIGQKCRHLHVDPIEALKCNCVSKKMAGGMALGICQTFTSDWGIGITGYATPVPESGDDLYAFMAIAYKGEVVLEQKLSGKKTDDALQVQLGYVDDILNALLQSLEK